MTRPALIRAAGCVVWRYGNREPEVVLVHRPRLPDWSFPKGKLNRGELPIAAAVREVEEETSLRVQLGPRLPDQHYLVNGRTPKVVSYWVAQAPETGRHHPLRAEPRDRPGPVGEAVEGPQAAHLPARQGAARHFAGSAYDSSPLLIVRHAQARTRKAWHKDDSDRPLRADGVRQALRLVPLLGAYGITRVVSSDSARCVDTILPYVNSTFVKLKLDPSISEDSVNPKRLARRVARALASRAPARLVLRTGRCCR